MSDCDSFQLLKDALRFGWGLNGNQDPTQVHEVSGNSTREYSSRVRQSALPSYVQFYGSFRCIL